jgi:lipopolysaccharide export system protein LptA
MPLILAGFIAASEQTRGQTTAAPAIDIKSPKAVDIEANEMEIIDTDTRAIFRGSVNARRSDVSLKCDTLVVEYSEVKQADGSNKTDVTHLDAKGNVVIVTANQTITGDWAKFDVKANKLNVGGNVKVVQGKTRISGPLLKVDLNTNRSEMSGGRVKGSFLPN